MYLENDDYCVIVGVQALQSVCGCVCRVSYVRIYLRTFDEYDWREILLSLDTEASRQREQFVM